MWYFWWGNNGYIIKQAVCFILFLVIAKVGMVLLKIARKRDGNSVVSVKAKLTEATEYKGF
ncbi:hypothetical protein [Flavobacterium ginsengiterrae]|uniref:Uncharacterized protein n=1 Tax=Flavobacterium ginsengiterrae TaxID=871695 RepID=A0ABP7GSL4_9FLAO